MTEWNTARDLKAEILFEEKRLSGLRMLLTHLTPILDGLPKATRTESKVELVTIKIIDCEGIIETLHKKFKQAQAKLTQKILTEVEEPTIQTLLLLYYVECLSFRETAHRMNYTLRQIFRHHSNFFKNSHNTATTCNGAQQAATV